jgi:esterase
LAQVSLLQIEMTKESLLMSEETIKIPSTKIIFVHGFLDDVSVWEEVISFLGDEFEVEAVDLPGFGAHVDDQGPFTLSRLAAAVVDHIDASETPVVLVGQSMGAQLGELAAALRPGKVKGLVLLTPVPLAGVHLTGEAAHSFRSLGSNADAQRQGRLDVSVSLSPRALEVLVASGTAAHPEVVAATFDAWNAGDPAGLSPSAYAGPSLIVRGNGDPFVTEDVIRAGVLPRFENAEFASIEGVGHFPHLENPAEVARLVCDFVRTLNLVDA